MRNVLFIFGQLGDRDVEWLSSLGTVVNVPEGEALIREGEAIQDVYLTLRGSFAVERQGRELARIGPGEMLGEMSFVEASRPSADVRADIDSKVLRIPREALQRRLDQDGDFAGRFYRGIAMTLSARLRDSDPSLTDVEERDGVLGPDELDPNVMESLTRAGERFDRLVKEVTG